MALNDLPPHPHNAFVKLFASREREREAAFAALDAPAIAESPRLYAFMVGLQQTLGVKGGNEMAEMLTPDKIMEIGSEKIRQHILETTSLEEILEGVGRQKILARFAPQERMAGLTPQERVAGMTKVERRQLLHLLQDDVDAATGDMANTNRDDAA